MSAKKKGPLFPIRKNGPLLYLIHLLLGAAKVTCLLLFMLNALLQLLQAFLVLLDLILQGSQVFCCTSVFATLKAFEALLRHMVKQFILQNTV